MGTDMNLFDIVDSRRSVRDYQNREVPKEIIEKVLAYALRAPSGGNLQPWNIHVVQGDSLERLNATMRHRLWQSRKSGESVTNGAHTA